MKLTDENKIEMYRLNKEGYYVSTLGLNESTIRKYIREQE